MTDNIRARKATLYVSNEVMGNIEKIEVRAVEVVRKPWAQYASAVCYRYREPRQRRWRGYAQGYKPYLVVLEGWSHVDPSAPMEVLEESLGMTVSRSRYSFCSDEWIDEFDQILDAYLKANPKVRVLGDYRGVSTHDPKIAQEYKTQQKHSIAKQLRSAGVSTKDARRASCDYVIKSPNWAAGWLCEKGYNCTKVRGRHRAEALRVNGKLIEPEEFWS
jgi:hypothetical protein